MVTGLRDRDTMRSGQGFFNVKVLEARLAVNVAKFGHMQVVAEVTHGKQVFRTKAAEGQQPQWHEAQNFELTSEAEVQVQVLHSTLLLGSTLIGACTVPLPLASKRQRSGWWDLLSSTGLPVGSIRLSFGFEAQARTQDTECAVLREMVSTKANEVELEREELEFLKLKYKRKAEKLSQEERKYRAKAQAIEVRAKEDTSLHALVSPRTIDEPGRRQRSIALREDLLASEQKRLEAERTSLERFKAEVEKIRDEISLQGIQFQEDRKPRTSSLKRTSLSHDTLPSFDLNTADQLSEIKQIRLTLDQKERNLDTAMRESEIKRKEIAELRKGLERKRAVLHSQPDSPNCEN